MDLQARAAGWRPLLKHAIAPGTTVPVGNVVGVIGAAGEDVSALVSAAPQEGGRCGEACGAPATPAAAPCAEGAAAAAPTAPAPARRPLPHLLRRLAAVSRRRRCGRRRSGRRLARVQGLRPEGRIVVRDLENAPAAAAAPAGFAATPTVSTGFEDVPLTQIRKTIAKRLTQSIGPVPTFYLTTEIDMERSAEAREALNQAAPADQKVSFNDIVIKAVASPSSSTGPAATWWQDDRIRYWNDVREHGRRRRGWAHRPSSASPTRSRSGRSGRRRRTWPGGRATGGSSRRNYTETFSIAGIGMFDIDQFTAVINPPEAASSRWAASCKPAVVNRRGGAAAALRDDDVL
ncbi:MAG: 2-oxo acid dehydrogenase subunit E2 [Gemmatimonadales bacterium]